MSRVLEIWLDSELQPMTRVGVLAHDRGQIRFHYDSGWVRHPTAFALDPDLSLGDAPFFPRPEAGNFGIFLDSAPDRWGQTLMKRREALQAKDEGRSPRTLGAWDYLIGVQDFTRQGALRFRFEREQEFLGAERLAAPPVVRLRELEDIAKKLTSKRIDDLDELRRWLAVLVAPGASLGGARPKANFTEEDGSLWIGKFPARDDDRDIGAWEFLAHELAVDAGIDVPAARVLRLSNEHHTFCVKRFDRTQDDAGATRRRFYASAMTLLGKDQSEGTSYLEIAEFIHDHGSAQSRSDNLRQLFRRVAFNVAVGNRDDHLRNHGFLWAGGAGWKLSPAYDVNPVPQDVRPRILTTGISFEDGTCDLDLVLSVAELFGLSQREAKAIVKQVGEATATWREVAETQGARARECERMRSAFEHADLEKAQRL